MRLYLKDSGDEITGVHFNSVRKVLNTGGGLSCYIRDKTLANVVWNFGYTMERMEVRKNDGSTVIWEGAIDKCTQYSQPTWQFHMNGKEILSFLDRTPSNYNSINRQGVVTALAGDEITDANAAFSNMVVGLPVFFSNDNDGESSEIIFPHANSTWYNDGAADDPADTETKTTAGDETDLAAGGASRYWEIHDSSNRGKDYYGIDLHFEATYAGESDRVVINIDCMFNHKTTYVNEAATPIFQIYDVTAVSWESDDTNNAGNIVGLGRTGFFSEGWDIHGTRYKAKIEITANCDRYWDVSDILKIRVMCGEATHTENYTPSFERVRVQNAILTNVYDGRFDTAAETVYIIDVRDSSTKLSFTGQTPDTDGVDVGSTYSIGNFFHTIMSNIWSYSQISWVDLDFDTTTLGEANDYRGMYVGHVLSDFSERLNRDVWQAVGWVIKCYGSYTDTALNLTEDNFLEWSMSMTSDETFGQVTVWGSGTYGNVSWSGGTYYTPEGKFYVDTRWSEYAMGLSVVGNYESKYATSKRIFTGTIDLDDGTDYSALDVGKGVDILINTNKILISQGVITELSYEQNAGEHLMCNIVVRYDP